MLISDYLRKRTTTTHLMVPGQLIYRGILIRLRLSNNGLMRLENVRRGRISDSCNRDVKNELIITSAGLLHKWT
jgi:hypothetical protein